MASTQARTMPGAMELLPPDQIAFQRMLDIIRGNFERFGFLPIETPVMEFSDVLLTKQGGETERQVYFVQSTGALEQGGKPELALRFDLTVPLARYVAEHEHELSFPFRRYQIQRVYRGERAQRGRFREFYQCDIDVIGKDQLSVRYDAEMPAVIYNVFKDLDFGPFTIKINNRKFLRGFMETQGIPDGERQALVLREIDKLDKSGMDVVLKNLQTEPVGLSFQNANNLINLLYKGKPTPPADVPATFDNYERLFPELRNNQHYLEGKAELIQVFNLLPALGVPESAFGLDTSITRGLDYYTGTVYETMLDGHSEIGSICSGGRYDNLAANYTKSNLPGVGISIGITRLFYQLREKKLLKAVDSTVQALVTHMDESLFSEYLQVANLLRGAGIATEVVLEAGKLGKQFKYADRAGIRFVVVIGPDEIAKATVTVKDMRKQNQFEVARADLVETLRGKLAEAMPQ